MTLTIFVAALITLGVLIGAAKMTTVGPWYRALRKPWWNPPEWAFGPAWAVILSVTAWGGVEAWTSTDSGDAHARIALLFAINIFFYALWTPIFFNLKRPDWALVEVAFLWLSVAALLVGLGLISSKAGLLMLPYLLWVTFAAYLNLKIVRLNAPFGGGALPSGA
jgi:translocator protein